jgi:methenyltetrahydrofolate cyclohydrolase
MMPTRSQTLRGYLDALASSEPAPGGGSASALAGAAGASLLLMVVGLPRTRTGTPDEATALAEVAATVRPHRAALIGLVQQDADAYWAVVHAYRMARATDAERAARTEAIQAALRGATETPLATLRACQEVIARAPLVARRAVSAAVSDVAVAVELLWAAADGADRNVHTNLVHIADEAWAAKRRAEARTLRAKCAESAGQARHALADR